VRLQADHSRSKAGHYVLGVEFLAMPIVRQH